MERFIPSLQLTLTTINMDTLPSIKEVSRSALVAFAPDAPFLAAGTMARAETFNQRQIFNLDIFQLDFQSDDRKLPLVGSVSCTAPFNRLSWGESGLEEFSLGLVAGGLVDGNTGIWNPRRLIGSEESESSIVQTLSRHKGPVRGLEFSSLSPNHLASGAEEGDICIWDISRPATPTHFPPLNGSGSATKGEISFLSWNKKVQPILASTYINGTTAVWDLRKQKPIISLPDSVKSRCSVLQWHPDVATQLIVASDDDSSPSLRMWDMRNTMSPLREFVGHTKGIVAMSWCRIDSAYLLTCAKDNRTICWDTNSAEIVCELPSGANRNYDVHWHPKIPGVISASSFDEKIGIYNIEACARYGAGDTSLVSAPLKAPKWYQRKAGVTFGFGDKLISFHSTDSPSAHSEVNVRNLVTDYNPFVLSEFEAAMRSRDQSSLRLLCEHKYQESESDDERETWRFLNIMFVNDGTASTKLLNYLGFTIPPVGNETTEYDLSHDHMSFLNLKGKEVVKEGFLDDNREDFHNNLPSPETMTSLSTSVTEFGTEEWINESDSLEGISDSSLFEDAVQRALVVKDFKGAVALCIAANKMADALVIAQVGGDSLWETTCDQYLKKNSSPYLKVVAAMANNNLVSLVNTIPLIYWKETLTLLFNFAKGDNWTVLCDTLASRLLAAGNSLAATICYICAQNIDKTVEIWSKNVTSEHEGKSHVDLLQDLMEKTAVHVLATGRKTFSDSLCKLVEKYVEMLVSQGLITAAMEYLKLMGTDSSPELSILRYRIALLFDPEENANGSMDSGSSQLPIAPAYGFTQPNPVVEPYQHYYQDDVAYTSQNYQQPPAIAYPSDQYQHQQEHPTTHVLSPAPNFPPVGFTPQPPVQPAPQVFISSNLPIMINADQYQQAPSFDSQLYAAQSNDSQIYQFGPRVVDPYQASPSLSSMSFARTNDSQNYQVGPKAADQYRPGPSLSSMFFARLNDSENYQVGPQAADKYRPGPSLSSMYFGRMNDSENNQVGPQAADQNRPGPSLSSMFFTRVKDSQNYQVGPQVVIKQTRSLSNLFGVRFW